MLIRELQAIQRKHGYLPDDELNALSERLKKPLYEIHGVATFYPHFRFQPPPDVVIGVCADMSCHLRGACEIKRIFEDAAGNGWCVSETACIGQCDAAPAIAVNGRSVRGVTPSKARRLVDQLAHGTVPRRVRVSGTDEWQASAVEPYATLDALFETSDSDGVIAALKESGLRGMGGAGFPTGIKWETTRDAPATPKYVVCNADESEPGTFKDRAILQHLPHLVVEGMFIGALVVGAEEVIVYLRHEYEREGEILRREIQRAQRRFRWLKSRISVEVFESPGGYICGEETALLEALEGKRAEPRNRPPFPATHGLWGKPTLLNNVETFAWVPVILNKGPEWFKAQGVNGGEGLKFLALSGHVRQPGVYEVPLGISAANLINKHGGGVGKRKKLKAFAPGGASSGFLPASMADISLEFRVLQEAGSMLGSGAVVAVADGTCMLDLALNVVKFFRNESCGKCVPCRLGSQQIVATLERFRRGDGGQEDVELIDELAETMLLTSICGLGQAAPNPILSVIKYFRDEVFDHLQDKCPSGACLNGS